MVCQTAMNYRLHFPTPLPETPCDPTITTCNSVTVYASDTCLDGMPGWSCGQSDWIFTYWEEIYNPESLAQNNAPQTQTKTCKVSARVLQGNPATVGAPLGKGAFNNPPNPIAPQANSAAMTPSEFGGLSSTQLKPYALQISGYFPGTGVSFQGVTDVNGAGQTPLGFSNIRQYLEALNPNQVIIELITGPDLGSNVPAVLTVPAALPCPTPPPVVGMDAVTGPTVG